MAKFLSFIKSSSRTDWLGVFASIVCAVHCAAMPFIISYLPALGLSFLADALFHKVMVFVCFSIAIYAFIPGLKKHRKWAPVTIGTLGLMLISVAAFGVEEDLVILPDGTEVPACCVDECDDDALSVFEYQAVIEEGDDPTTVQDLLSQFALWLTPLGGGFLVLGHLLNKRFGNDCNCCSAEVSEEETA